MSRISIYALSCLMVSCAYAEVIFAQDSLQGWMPKVAVTDDGATAYIVQFEAGKILRLTSDTIEQGEPAVQPVVVTEATSVVDMKWNAANDELLIACEAPPRLIRQPLDGSQATTIPLPAAPARLALTIESDGNCFVCVSLPSAHSLWIGALGKEAKMESSGPVVEFAAKEVEGLGKSMFIVADASSNRLVVVDAERRAIAKTFKMNAYHLSGLAMDVSSNSLLVSHQVLSSNARTDRDDIRWGSLIQNNVSSIPLSALSASKSRLDTDTTYRIGDFGHGASDPAGVVSMGGSFAVAVSGSDEVGIYSKQQRQARFVTVGHVPDRLYRLGNDRLLCVHRLDQRIAIIKTTEAVPRLERMLGEAHAVTTAEQRGELAFYSGLLSHDGWMSCNSCHVESGSPDLLVDTLGDGTFDSPKKIPSLENVTQTGPWAWHGGQSALSDQLAKTLATTMHIPDELPGHSGLSRETIVEDLVAYLSTRDALKSKRASDDVGKDSHPDLKSEVSALAGGEALFFQHCARCHDPGQHFTTPKNYDVGINDERGIKLFNPPSLEGLRRRTRYMHDGRFERLEQVLTAHPQPAIKFSEPEQQQLKAYLLSL